MARHLKYEPEATTSVTPREELEALIDTLHSSGTLRVLNGFFGRIGSVSEVAMQEAATPEGQNTFASAALLLKAFAQIDPDELEALLEAVKRGAGEASEVLREEPPSTIDLLRLLHDPETRRGLHACLSFVRHLGRDSIR